MIVIQDVIDNGVKLKKTYSDSGMMIAFGLERYDVAYDSPESTKTYSETIKVIPGFTVDADVALNEMMEVLNA